MLILGEPIDMKWFVLQRFNRRVARRPRSWDRRRVSKRGIADVVATVLILAITVVLASTLFIFVNAYPKAPTPPAEAFNTVLTYGPITFGGGPATGITFVSITHDFGPAVSAAATSVGAVFLESQVSTYRSGALTFSSGLGGSSTWSDGHVWKYNVTSQGLPAYDNITVEIVVSGQVLYKDVAPGHFLPILPYFTSTGASPSHPGVSTWFLVTCGIVFPEGPNATSPATINISKLPGSSGAAPKPLTYSASTGLWSYNVSGGVTPAGTYAFLITAKDSRGVQNFITLQVRVG